MFYKEENAPNTFVRTRGHAHIMFWPSETKISKTRVWATKGLALLRSFLDELFISAALLHHTENTLNHKVASVYF